MAPALRDVVGTLRDHPAVRGSARLGLTASGALHLLISWTALELAFVEHGTAGRQPGPFRQLAGTPLGGALLWLIATGFAALTLWQLMEALHGPRLRPRLKSVARALVYGLLALAAAGVADGPGDGDPMAEDVAAALMQGSLGVAVVVAVAIAVIGAGVHHCVRAWRGSFIRDLRSTPDRWVLHAGRAGYAAKGVALIIGGGLLVSAAAGYRRGGPQGLDAALGLILSAPAGPVVLSLMAVGFAGYGAYALARARHAWW